MDLPRIDQNVAEVSSDDVMDRSQVQMAPCADACRTAAITQNISDLIALKQMADYLKNELQRLHSRCSPMAAILPQMISEEICDLLLRQAESA